MIEISKIISEVGEIPKVVITFKNWWVYFLNISRLPNAETVCRLRNGTKFIIRANSFDIRMIKEVYIHKSYHHLEINEGDIVVDIGAHIGTFSIMAGCKIGKKGVVYAYEPVPTTFEILKKNVNINSLQDIVIPCKQGISNESGKKDFFTFGKGDKTLFHSSSFYREQTEVIDATVGEKIKVECITLEDIFEINGLDIIDILKMDCEGEEYNLLFGTSEEYLRKINKMCIEYHDYLSSCYNHQDIIRYLSKLDYDVFHEVPVNLEDECGIIYAWRKK
jgi:FkbM family methyltransferase